MQYFVYILYSHKLSCFYVGHTTNLKNRLTEHNSGESKYTSQRSPWIIIWSTTKPNRRLAEDLEFKLKNLSRIRKIKFIKKYSEGISDIELFKKLEAEIQLLKR